jgi:hypothetical protein
LQLFSAKFGFLGVVVYTRKKYQTRDNALKPCFGLLHFGLQTHVNNFAKLADLFILKLIFELTLLPQQDVLNADQIDQIRSDRIESDRIRSDGLFFRFCILGISDKTHFELKLPIYAMPQPGDSIHLPHALRQTNHMKTFEFCIGN